MKLMHYFNSLDFEDYIYDCWEVVNARTDRELVIGAAVGITDLINATNNKLIHRTEAQIQEQLEKWDMLCKEYNDLHLAKAPCWEEI